MCRSMNIMQECINKVLSIVIARRFEQSPMNLKCSKKMGTFSASVWSRYSVNNYTVCIALMHIYIHSITCLNNRQVH